MADQAEFETTNQPATAAMASSNSEPDGAVADQPHGIRLNADKHIELLPIDQLVPYSRNPRTHSRKQLRQLVDSMRRYGFTAPVLIDENNQILAGHGRVEAAKLAGLVAVPALRLSHLSPAEKRGYVIFDNRIGEKAGWDYEILADEMQALVDLNFDVTLTGFEPGEIDLTLADADEARREAAGPEDRIPEPRPDRLVSRPGDLWHLGPHRLLCGDARVAADYDRLLQSETASFVFTDVPFNLPVNGGASRSGQHREFAMASGEMTEVEYIAFLQTVFGQLVAHSDDGAVHDTVIDWRHVGQMLTAGQARYSRLLNIAVWAKSHFGMGNFYRSQHELICIWQAGNGAHINNLPVSREGRRRSNLWAYPSMVGRRDELMRHPTPKPVQMVVDAIKDCSARGGIVLDVFAGSGTTIIAAQRTGRRGRGIEIEPLYVDVAVRRWQEYTGKAATLDATGQSFEEVAEQRLGQSAAESPQSVPMIGEAA